MAGVESPHTRSDCDDAEGARLSSGRRATPAPPALFDRGIKKMGRSSFLQIFVVAGGVG